MPDKTCLLQATSAPLQLLCNTQIAAQSLNAGQAVNSAIPSVFGPEPCSTFQGTGLHLHPLTCLILTLSRSTSSILLNDSAVSHHLLAAMLSCKILLCNNIIPTSAETLLRCALHTCDSPDCPARHFCCHYKRHPGITFELPGLCACIHTSMQ